MRDASRSSQRLVFIELDTAGIDAMAKLLKEAPAIMQEELSKAVTALALFIEGEAKHNCPVDTGNLRASIHTVVESLFEAYVGTNTQYAPDVEYGTDPHVITARNAKALHFFGKNGPVFARSVKHPGTTAQPYLEPAYEAGRKRSKRVFDAAMQRAMKRLERMLPAGEVLA